MSRFDRELGHVRRYRRSDMTALAEATGLRVEACRYINAPGFFGWLVGMRILGGRPRAGLMLRAWDRAMVPLAAWLDRRCPMPFGQSVFFVGRVRGVD
jgi:hypothetical protein